MDGKSIQTSSQFLVFRFNDGTYMKGSQGMSKDDVSEILVRRYKAAGRDVYNFKLGDEGMFVRSDYLVRKTMQWSDVGKTWGKN